jgi:hypothetical protein
LAQEVGLIGHGGLLSIEIRTNWAIAWEQTIGRTAGLAPAM